MTKKTIFWLMPILIIGLIFSGCSPKAEYESKLKHELASGVRYDSLFLGLYLGMPQKEFFKHCWELNREGLIRQGSTNTTVEYRLNNTLKYPATLDFYPKFVKGKISEMPVRFVYSGWAPWNKRLTADSLQLDVLNYYKKQYGDDFMEVKHPTRGSAYVKINGNRQISIFKEDELHVWAVFTDILVKGEPVDTTNSASIHADTTKKIN